MSTDFLCHASAAFGMEKLVADELKSLNIHNVVPENGGVRFTASAEELYRCNLRSHFCDRLFIVLGESVCLSFDQLFRFISGIGWEEWITGNESIDVSAKCVKSMLMSPRDCQSITKKAVIERLKKRTGRTVFPEDGPSFPILVSFRKDQVSVLLNTSGTALSRRGYRTWNGEAPLRETLAAALVALSPWKYGTPLHDPCCGTGTIVIEAALMAAQRAPGVMREFAMDQLECFEQTDCSRIRNEMKHIADFSKISDISGSDIDPEALSLASRHIVQAGLDPESIPLQQIPLQELVIEKENGTFICNPPYGERLSDQRHSRALCHELFLLKQRHPSWHLCAISSDPAFERSYGKRADKKRRLYNGRLECVYYTYY